MTIRSIISSLCAITPNNRVDNHQLAQIIDTSDEWIKERTGIRSRYISSDLETTSTLATKAAKLAIKEAGIDKHDIDLIICATSTPDRTFPATATLVQAALHIPVCVAFDVQAVCSGFVYGLGIVDAMIKSGQYKTALLIGADSFSRIMDWSDRTTCVLFGDGAGAAIIQASSEEEAHGKGILSNILRADGRYNSILNVSSGPSMGSKVGKLHMEGQAVFRHAVTNISEAIVACCEHANKSISEIDWFVPHQANKRILDGVAKKLKISEDKVIITVDIHGNTSAASVPLAFHHAKSQGKIKKGDLVLFEAMGGGLTWGASLVQF